MTLIIAQPVRDGTSLAAGMACATEYSAKVDPLLDAFDLLLLETDVLRKLLQLIFMLLF